MYESHFLILSLPGGGYRIHPLSNEVFACDIGAAVAHGKWWVEKYPAQMFMILSACAPELHYYREHADGNGEG